MSYGATPHDWLNLDLLGYGQDLLPVVSNLSAPISPRSTLKAIGKVPSKYDSQGQIIGIPNWTQKQATPKELETWAKNPDYGICIQTREIRALDVDVGDPVSSQRILDFLCYHFPAEIIQRRRSNSSKFLVPFVVKGEFPKRVMKVENGIVEFLANGQQFVAIGTHTSGVHYEGLENIDSFPEIAIEQFETLWKALSDSFAVETPSEGALRNPPSVETITALEDDTATYLFRNGQVTGTGKEQQLFIRCPFSDGHTDPDAPDGTSTAYLPAGNRDYQQGHFSCLHASCAHREDSDFLDAFGIRAADFDLVPLTPEEEATSKDKANRFQPIQAGEFADRDPPGWIIDELLPHAEFGFIYGASQAYKSFVSIDMGMCIATGRPWLGKETKKGKVIYVCAEGSGNFKLRLRAYAQHHHIDLKTADFHVIEAAPSLLAKEDISELLLALAPYGECAAVFIDTLAQTTPGGDENSGKDMSRALGNIKKLSKATGAIIIAVHHAGKDLARGARGWSGLIAAADVAFELTAVGKLTSRLNVFKQKDGETGLSWAVNMVKVALPSSGKPLSSLIPTYEVNEGAREEVLPKKMGYWQGKVLEALDELGAPAIAEGVIGWALDHGHPRDMTLNEKGKLKPDRRLDMCREAIKTLNQAKTIKLFKGTISRDLTLD